MTVNQLIKTAQSKRFILDFRTDSFSELIGINKGKHNWHWFRVYEKGICFDHTYSQITGKRKKGIMHEISVKKSLGFYK